MGLRHFFYLTILWTLLLGAAVCRAYSPASPFSTSDPMPLPPKDWAQIDYLLMPADELADLEEDEFWSTIEDLPFEVRFRDHKKNTTLHCSTFRDYSNRMSVVCRVISF